MTLARQGPQGQAAMQKGSIQEEDTEGSYKGGIYKHCPGM